MPWYCNDPSVCNEVFCIFYRYSPGCGCLCAAEPDQCWACIGLQRHTFTFTSIHAQHPHLQWLNRLFDTTLVFLALLAGDMFSSRSLSGSLRTNPFAPKQSLCSASTYYSPFVRLRERDGLLPACSTLVTTPTHARMRCQVC